MCTLTNQLKDENNIQCPHTPTIKKKHTQTYPFFYPFPAIFLSDKQKLNFKTKGSQSELNKITF